MFPNNEVCTIKFFTDIRFDILERRRSGACIGVFCEEKLEAKEAIDGSDTMKVYAEE